MKFKVVVQDLGKEFSCSSDDDILNAAITALVKISSACRGGGCGVCKVKVVEGQFERGKCSKTALTDEERSQNYTLACKTYPRSDMTIVASRRK
jgi:CDP-4-dehydro-6-deoxyglucose reductase